MSGKFVHKLDLCHKIHRWFHLICSKKNILTYVQIKLFWVLKYTHYCAFLHPKSQKRSCVVSWLQVSQISKRCHSSWRKESSWRTSAMQMCCLCWESACPVKVLLWWCCLTWSTEICATSSETRVTYVRPGCQRSHSVAISAIYHSPVLWLKSLSRLWCLFPSERLLFFFFPSAEPHGEGSHGLRLAGC